MAEAGDLLRRFARVSHRLEESPAEYSGEIELNLGLSMGGRFGIDPKEKKLARSSSLAGISFFPADDDSPAGLTPARTCSLPVETEDEWRKRKEMQSLRRMEAKRKRTVKIRSFRVGVKDRASLERNCEEDKRGEEEGLFNGRPANGFSSAFGWADRRAGNYALNMGFPPSSQGPVTSQGSSSSGVSDFENRSVQGLSGCTDAKSPASDQSLPEHIEQKAAISVAPSGEKSGKAVAGEEVENPCKKMKIENGVVEMGRNVMEEMPCVSTRGGGPNGKKIEGFLYRYRNGEEVRIVCVCHGSFLTPAEFVKHAGGGDVAHPLRHIVVTPSPSLL